MYKSPITMIIDDMAEKLVKDQEDCIVQCVQNVGISVDKAELERALAYDSQQYEKGFEDGKMEAKRWIPVSERLPEFDELVLVWVENKDPKGRFNKPGIHKAQLKNKEPKHDPEGKMNFWGIPGYDSEWTVWSWSYFSEPDVKAWMPLPEPYKEGK